MIVCACFLRRPGFRNRRGNCKPRPFGSVTKLGEYNPMIEEMTLGAKFSIAWHCIGKIG
jgi:hypothetical protein